MTATNSETDPRLGIGGNNPPLTLKERIEETYAEQFAQVNALAAEANALPKDIANDDDVGMVADVAAKARKASSTLEALRKVEKDPYIRDGKIVDATFNDGRIVRLDAIYDGLSARVTKYNRAKTAKAREEQAQRERDARDAEEKARLDAAMEAEAGNYSAVAEHVEQAHHAKAEADQAAEPVKAADATRVRSAGGATVSTTTAVKHRVVDWEKVDLNKLRHFFKRDDIDKALRAFVRINKATVPVEGVEFFDDETALIRS